MGRLNRREKKLVTDMRDIMDDVELEMVHLTDYDEFDELVPALCGWYPCMYTGSEPVRITNSPLITDAEIKKYHVNTQKCFEEVGAYVRSNLGC